MAERVAPQVAIFSRIGQRADADAIEHNPDYPLEQSHARSCTAGVPPVLFSNDRAAVNLPHCSAALSARSSPIIACEVARLHRAGSASSRMLERKMARAHRSAVRDLDVRVALGGGHQLVQPVG